MKPSLAFALLLLLSGRVLGNLAMKTQVAEYSGDGLIQDCSLIVSPGYRIEFPRFSAESPFDASYRLSHVPQLHHDPLLLLRFYQPDFVAARKKKSAVTASFHVTLSDAFGRVQHSADIPLSRAWWGESQRLFGIYDLEKSRLHFDREASYTLHVSYEPGRVPPPTKQLYFSLENGCSK